MGAAKRKELISDTLREEYVLRYRGKAKKLARSILRRWRSRLDIEEVDSLVDLSLCEAANRFNPERGAGFMTFLFYHLRGNLIRAITFAVQKSNLPLIELDSLVTFEDEKVTAIDIADALTSECAPSPEDALYMQEMIALSRKSYEKLDDLEKSVLTQLFAEEVQMNDIARNLGYSRCHISRVKRRALEALHGEISSQMKVDDIILARPDFDDEETPRVVRRSMDRRKIVRRRPRSAEREIRAIK